MFLLPKLVNLEVLCLKIIKFFPIKDNFMNESAIQHIKINYLNIKQLLIFQERFIPCILCLEKHI